MTYTILFAITLVLVSGLIAYLGDLIGRRMGKKRLTLFGLRPRHTAIIFTTITGMLIAIITLATLLVVDSNFRQVFVKGERLAKENAVYQIRNRTLHRQNVELTAASSRLTKEVLQKSSEVQIAQKAAKAALHDRDRIQFLARDMERDIQTRKVELAELRRTGRLTELQLKRISETLKGRVQDLAEIKSELAKRNSELEARQGELVAKTQELQVKMAALDKAQTLIDQIEQTIRTDEELMKGQMRKLMQATDVKDMLLTGDVVLQSGQEISRAVIDSSESESQVRADIVALLDTASARAKRAGAGADGAGRAVQLVFRDNEKRSIIYPPNENVLIGNAVNSVLSQGRGKAVHGVLMRVVAVNNTLRGETASVELNLYWNNLAFRRGDSIARRTIDGGMSEGRILLAVMAFLREDVRPEAQKAGVVPVAGPDPEKAMEAISDAQLDQLMELVQQIRSIGKQVELRAMAEKDIYYAGPINLDNIGFAISTLGTAKK